MTYIEIIHNFSIGHFGQGLLPGKQPLTSGCNATRPPFSFILFLLSPQGIQLRNY